MPGRFSSIWGNGENWRIWDHGDSEVDSAWRGMLSYGAAQESLGGELPFGEPEYVPAEYADSGRIPDSWFVCMDILSASEDGTLLE